MKIYFVPTLVHRAEILAFFDFRLRLLSEWNEQKKKIKNKK